MGFGKIKQSLLRDNSHCLQKVNSSLAMSIQIVEKFHILTEAIRTFASIGPLHGLEVTLAATKQVLAAAGSLVPLAACRA
jgi:hypothetical protein